MMRRMALSAISAAVGGLIVAALGMAPRPAVVEARAFLLKGDDGKTRGAWILKDDGSQSLLMGQPKGGSIGIAIKADGSAQVEVQGKKKGAGAILGVDADGSPAVWVRSGGQSAAIGAGADGRAGFRVEGPDGREAFHAP